MTKQTIEIGKGTGQLIGLRAIWVSAVSMVLMFCVLGGQALAADRKVGDTKDACGRQNVVKFEGKAGPQTFGAPMAKAVAVELPSSTREIH